MGGGGGDLCGSGYTNGEFLVHTKQGGYFYLYRAPACNFEDFTVEVDARWSGQTGNSYGLIFSVKPDFSEYYLFDINTDTQSFRLYRALYPSFFPLVNWTYSPAIQPGLASNHLMVIRSGGYIRMYVNGSEIRSVLKSWITGATGVGIVSSPYLDRPVSDALFDNFNFYDLPAASGTTSSAGAANSEMFIAPMLEKFVDPWPEAPGW